MAKYHVNPRTNRPNICRADKQGCPLQAQGAPHFDNKEDAHKHIEKTLSEKNNITASKSKEASNKEARERFALLQKYSIPSRYERGIASAGGNYLRLKDSGVNPHDTAIVKQKIDNDIEKAIKAGELPETISGKKLSYRIETERGEINAYLDTKHNKLDMEPYITEDRPGEKIVMMDIPHKEEHKAAKEKLSQIVDSYNYKDVHENIGYNGVNFITSTVTSPEGSAYDMTDKEDRARELILNTLSKEKAPDDYVITSYENQAAKINELMDKDPQIKQAVSDIFTSRSMSNRSIEISRSITNESYGVNEDGKPEKVRDKQLQDLSDKAASLMQEGRKEHAYIANNNNKATRFQQMTSYGRAHIEKENKERFLSDLFYQHANRDMKI